MAGSPSRFGPYEIVRRLGAGGMAETFLGVRRGPGGFEQKVCIKRILPAFEQDSAFVHQFLEEARVSAQLRHTNIAQVLDFGVAEESHYLALELVEGMDLAKLLRALHARDQTMTSGLVVYVAVELANALDYAHGGAGQSAGPVVHRDISPSNVLVSRAGEVKLTDFGIAKAANQAGVVTATGVVKGKAPYMAPEYARSGEFDARSDLFALGVVLFESLAGRRPFVGATDLDTMQRILDGQHPPLAQLCPTAPRALVDAIERMIDRSPAKRFASAAELLDALVDIAPPPTARRILGELVRKAAEAPPAAEPASAKPRAPAAPEEGTEAITDAARQWKDPEPTPAAPTDRTRTRAPLASEAPATIVSHDVPATMEDALERAALTKTAPAPRRNIHVARTKPIGTPVATLQGVAPPAIDTAPRVDRRGLETPRAIESAKQIEPATDPRSPRRASPLLIAAAAALAIAIALPLGYAAIGSGADPAPTATAAPPSPPTAPATGPSADPEPTPTPAAAPAPTPAPTPAAAPAAALTPTPSAAPAAALTPTPSATPAPTRTPARSRPPQSPSPGATTAPTAAPEPGSIQVVVLPFGEVWIDGRHVGSAPLARSIAAGPHTIEAGPSETERTQRRQVIVRPGQQESVVFR